MLQKAYVATVQLLIVTETFEEACDGISSILSEYDMGDGTLKDWAYLEVGGQLLSPTPVLFDFDGYEESDFLK